MAFMQIYGKRVSETFKFINEEISIQERQMYIESVEEESVKI